MTTDSRGVMAGQWPVAMPPQGLAAPDLRPLLPGYPHVAPELLSSFPPVLRGVVRALGMGRAIEWLREYGGVNVNIPKYKTAALHLNAAELARLRRELSPHMDDKGRLWLPKCDKLLRLARNAQIRRDRPLSSITAIAHQYRLSSRQVINICGEREGNLNLSLF
jgi:Mor family transcriptional regulator